MTRETTIRELTLDFQLDRIAPGGRISLLALATNFNSEQDLRHLLPEGVEIFTNRIENANPVTLANLRAMAGDITQTARGMLPGLGVDVMIYGCTSGTVANGEDEIGRLINAAWPDIPVTNPVTAALAAFEVLAARRVSILTPYTVEVNTEMARYFTSQGVEVLGITGLGFEDDIEMTGIPPKVIRAAAAEALDPDADVLFISCTAIRSSLAIADIERDIDRPVVTSNQALVWHALKLLENPAPVHGYGRLFEKL